FRQALRRGSQLAGGGAQILVGRAAEQIALLAGERRGGPGPPALAGAGALQVKVGQQRHYFGSRGHGGVLSGRGGEAVAGTAHRLQVSGPVTEFAAEGADHDLDDVAAAAPVVAPYVAQQRRPADDPAFV